MREGDFTLDSIWNQKIKIFQPKKGYRFGLDAVLLAHFLKTGPNEKVLEVGTGSGIIAVLLSHLQSFQTLVALEIQPSLARYAAMNFEANGIRNIQLVVSDLQSFATTLPTNTFDLIFSNPPYRKLGSGKLNPLQEKALARHEITLKLENILQCAERLLKPEGRLSLILPTFREKDFEKYNPFVIHEWRYVHSFSNQPPVFFLVTAGRQKKSLLRHPPLILYQSPGRYTAETEGLLNADN